MTAAMLTDTTALVIGAAGGIGRTICADLLRHGSAVVAVDTDPAVGELRTERGTHPPVHTVHGDATRAEILDEAIATTTAVPGRLRTLVYAAFADDRRPILHVDDEGWERAQRVSLTGARRAAQAFARSVLGDAPTSAEAAEHLTTGPESAGAERTGPDTPATDDHDAAITFIASVHAFGAHPDFAAYAVAKSGLVALARALALELGPVGIRANAVAPGFIRVPRNAAAWHDRDRLAEIVGRAPLRRPGDPVDVAHAVSFLSSPAARFITGTCLPVDGGVLARLP